MKDGESIAVTTLSQSLQQLGCEVHLLAMNTARHYARYDELPDSLKHYSSVHTTKVDNRIKPWDAFIKLMANKSYHISRFESEAFRLKLKELLEKEAFDVVQLETLYLAPYISTIRTHSKAVICMRAHNVEHEIWERITRNTYLRPKKWYLKQLTRQLADYEKEQLKQYDILAAITKRDLERFQAMGYEGAATVIPIGIPVEQYNTDFDSYNKPLSLSFIGSLDWMPNQEGLKWFLDNAWDRLHQRFPKLEFHIAGRNTPNWLYELKKPNIKVHGEVPDAAAFINEHSLMIVPLLSGSGMRAKILEAMALGKVAITTSIGLEGIHAKDQQEVLVANSPLAFESAIEFCYSQNGRLEKMGRKAHAFIVDNYDNLIVGKKLIKAYNDLTIEAL